MKKFSGFLILFLALFISSIAAYFSVCGLAAIFPATMTAVILMGIALEAGKVASTGWLHFNWKNPKVALPHKIYMVSAIVALMLITSLGIYGFLAKGHLEEQTPLAPIELAISQKQSQIDFLNKDKESQNIRLTQLDSAVNSLIGDNRAVQGLKYRKSQYYERKQIQASINSDNVQIQKLTTDLTPLKLKINDVETKLGPIKYFGQLIGLKDTDAAVRIVILLLMFAFDPLALFLVISSTITISESFDKKPEIIVFDEKNVDFAPKDVPDMEIVMVETENPSSVIENSVEVENNIEVSEKMSDKDMLLDLLQKNPEFLQTIVEAVKENIKVSVINDDEKVEVDEKVVEEEIKEEEPPKPSSWLN